MAEAKTNRIPVDDRARAAQALAVVVARFSDLLAGARSARTGKGLEQVVQSMLQTPLKPTTSKTTLAETKTSGLK